jgi:hypothetical protein
MTRDIQRGPYRTDQGWHTFTVQKPWCSPARDILFRIMSEESPFKIPIEGYQETVKAANPMAIRKLALLKDEDHETYAESLLNGRWPKAQESTFRVPAQCARWAEELICRSRYFVVVGGSVDRNAEARGIKHGGRMPTPWAEHGSQPRKRSKGGMMGTLRRWW